MEVRKATSSQIQPQTDQKSEVSKTKSAGLNPIADSFEKENSKSSSSNSSSTASAEPEKKAGQITGGILIKQMTAARLGGVNQSNETSTKKELTPEQQSRVSNFNLQKQNPTQSSQDARSKDENRKNSGLQTPFAPPKTSNSEQQSKVNESLNQAKDLIGNSTKVQDGSQKDFSNDPLLNGTKLNDAVQTAIDSRHKEVGAVAGRTNSDGLSSVLDPTARGPKQSSSIGKDSLAYDKKSTVDYGNGVRTDFEDTAYHDEDGEHETHTETTYTKDGLTEFYRTETTKGEDNTVTVTETETFIQYDKDGNQIKDTTTTKTTTTKDDGSTQVVTTTTTNQDGKTTTDSHTEGTPAGGGAKSYNQENYTGNIPDELKKTMEYFKQQAISMKPSTGGETAHTDDNAEADSTVGGRVSNLVAQQGSVGLLGNPGSADFQAGQGGAQSPVGSSQSGGNVDYGPDSDQVGYNGPTHEDDPADVQFGPAGQPKAQTDAKKSEDANDSSTSNLDPLHNKKQRRDI